MAIDMRGVAPLRDYGMKQWSVTDPDGYHPCCPCRAA
jgi:hypothetical protein